MSATTDDPAHVTETHPNELACALRAAERCLADTAEAINSDTPPCDLFRYLVFYRARLAALVAASRPSTRTTAGP